MDWDECIFGFRREQYPDYPLSLFDEQVSQCTHSQQTYALYRTDCTHHGLENSYVNLRKWVQAHVESRSQESKKRQLLRTEEPRAAAGFNSSSNTSVYAKKSQQDCHQFLANGKYSRGDQRSFKHDWDKLKIDGKGKGKGKKKGKGDNKNDNNQSGGRSQSLSRQPSGVKSKSKGGGKQSPRPTSPSAGVRG